MNTSIIHKASSYIVGTSLCDVADAWAPILFLANIAKRCPYDDNDTIY